MEDSIVRSTTLRQLAGQLRHRGGAKEVHVRVACPPIISPCFYGIDMSTLDELFAPRLLPADYDGRPTAEMLRRMARELEVDSLRYLSVQDLGPCIQIDGTDLCTGCVCGKYPTPHGTRLMKLARRRRGNGNDGRTYE